MRRKRKYLSFFSSILPFERKKNVSNGFRFVVGFKRSYPTRKGRNRQKMARFVYKTFGPKSNIHFAVHFLGQSGIENIVAYVNVCVLQFQSKIVFYFNPIPFMAVEQNNIDAKNVFFFFSVQQNYLCLLLLIIIHFEYTTQLWCFSICVNNNFVAHLPKTCVKKRRYPSWFTVVFLKLRILCLVRNVRFFTVYNSGNLWYL